MREMHADFCGKSIPGIGGSKGKKHPAMTTFRKQQKIKLQQMGEVRE